MRSLLLLCAITVSAFADDWNKTWTVGQSASINADVADGRIELHGVDGNRIDARVTTTGWRIAPGEVTIAEQQAGDKVELTVRVPRQHWNFGSRSILVELRVPRQTLTRLHTGDGAVRVEGVTGQINVSTGDGSIEATNVAGEISARSGDGHIRVRGKLSLIDLDTGDGSVEADLENGSQMRSAWRVHTGDGHVTLRVPADFQATLDAHTGDGQVTVDLPMTVNGSVDKHSARGKVNGGGESLQIRTGDGSVRVQRI